MRHTRATTMVFLAVLIALLSVQLAGAIGMGTFETGLEYTPGQISSIKYYIVKEKGEAPTVSMDFTGNLSQYASFRIDNFWYSTRVDKLDVSLTRAFNLTDVASATLKFYTKYDIEYGWDFGYVEISTDNGSSWDQLSGTTTTTYRDPSAYVGINGAPAYTGSVSDWTLETIDLTPYAGNDVLLRFRYITDSYYAENGWFVDDISIEEIGFFDDVSSGNTTWESAGWLRNVLGLDEGVNAVPIYIDFTIPEDYVPDNATQKLMVTKIPGTEQGYNPSYGSVESVIVNFPPLIRIEPPTPPTPPAPGEGNKDKGKPYYARVIGDMVTYFIERFVPDELIELSSEDRKSLVRSIGVLVRQIIEDCVIRVTELPGKPASIRQELPDVYQYFEISTLNLLNSWLDEVVIQVAVEKSWIMDQGVDPEDIVVSRFSMGIWSDLDTDLVDEERGYYLYDASSPGFSVFAVRIRSPIPEPKVIEPVPTEKPNITDIKPVMVIIRNESAEETAAEIIEELARKSNVSAEDNLSRIPVKIVSVQRPATAAQIWNSIVLAMLIASVLFVASILFIFRPKKPLEILVPEKPKDSARMARKRKPAGDIERTDEEIIDEHIDELFRRLKDGRP